MVNGIGGVNPSKHLNLDLRGGKLAEGHEIMAGIEELVVLGLGVGLDKFSQIYWGFVLEKWFSPFDEIAEIYVCGKVLESRVLIDGGAFDALLEQISTQRAMRSAVVQITGERSVIDGEHFSSPPDR